MRTNLGCVAMIVMTIAWTGFVAYIINNIVNGN